MQEPTDSPEQISRMKTNETVGDSSHLQLISAPESFEDDLVGSESPQVLPNEEKSKHDLSTVIQDQRIQLAEKDLEITKLKGELRLLKDAKKELGSATNQINELEEKRRKIMQCKEQLGITIQTLKQEKETAVNQIEVLRKTVASQKSTIELNAQLIKDLQIKVSNHKNLALTFMDEVYDKDENEDNDENQNSSRGNALLLKDMKSLEEENSVFKNEIQQIKQRLKDAEEIANVKNSEVQLKDGVIESLKTEQKELALNKTEEINGLKGFVKNLEAKATSDHGKYTSLQNELESTQIDRETWKLEAESLRKKLADTQAELCSTNMLVEKLRSETTEPDVWNAMKANLESKDQTISELRDSENFLNEQITQVRKELQSYSKQLEVEKRVGKNQETEIRNLNQTLVASKEQASRLLMLNEELHQQKLSIQTRVTAREGRGGMSAQSEAEDVEVDMQTQTKQDLHEAVRNNKLCIREINQHKSCRPRSKNGCSYSHDIPEDLDNSTRNSLMLLWSEKHRKCAYEFISRGSCKDKESCTQCINKTQKIESRATKNQPRYCFSELKHEGSCRWGKDDCRFDHEIPADLREDKAAQTAYIQEKEDKRGKCINEYRREGSCRKGKELCRFSHNISAEERADTDLQAQMKLRYEKIANPDQKINTPTTMNGSLNVEVLKKMFNQFIAQISGTITSDP